MHVEDFAYYSPERLNDGKRTTTDDVYAFAILASECLTLQTPYEEDELDEVLEEVCTCHCMLRFAFQSTVFAKTFASTIYDPTFNDIGRHSVYAHAGVTCESRH